MTHPADRIANYLGRHGPVTWPEIAAGTSIAKETIFDVLRAFANQGRIVWTDPTEPRGHRQYSLAFAPKATPKARARANPTGAAWFADQARRKRHLQQRNEELRQTYSPGPIDERP